MPMNSHRCSHYQRGTLAFLIGVLLTFTACGLKTKSSDGKQPVLLYKKDAVIRFKVEKYIYLARVKEDTFADAQHVPVHIFTQHLQRKIRDTISIEDVKGSRDEPVDGWGTFHVAAEYFDGKKWTFAWDVQVMEDHYLLPETFQGIRHLDFSDVRFPIPIQR